VNEIKIEVLNHFNDHLKIDIHVGRLWNCKSFKSLGSDKINFGILKECWKDIKEFFFLGSPVTIIYLIR